MKKSKSQKDRVLEYLKQRPLDPLVAWSYLGVYRLSAVIFLLRKEGYKIVTGDKNVTNQFGEVCTVGEYVLVNQ